MSPFILALLVVSFVVLLSAVGQAIKDDESLVLYFPFDEGTGKTAQDQSGNKNDGTIDGADWVKDGKVGSALSFDGSDTVTVKDNDSLDVTSITVEAWIKPSKDWQKGIGTNPGIFHKWNPGGYLLYLENMWGTISLYLPHGDAYVRSKQEAWKNGVWYHVAATYDEKNGVGKVYVNGVLESDVAEDGVTRAKKGVAGKLAPNNNNLIIGKYNETFSGVIDEAALYNRVLTEEEINQDMNKGILYAVSPADRLATTWASLKNDRR